MINEIKECMNVLPAQITTYLKIKMIVNIISDIVLLICVAGLTLVVIVCFILFVKYIYDESKR